MNLADLTRRCQRRIAEVSTNFFDRDFWRDCINDAQVEFARETKIIRRRAFTTTVPGQASYPLDSDFFQINVVRWGREPFLKVISPYDYESHFDEKGIPTHYLVTGQEILLWPTPMQSEELVVWYYASPKELVTDSDVPEIPTVYHASLVPGACYRALRADKDYAGADRFEAEWQREMQMAIRQLQEQTEQFARVRDTAGMGAYLYPWPHGW